MSTDISRIFGCLYGPINFTEQSKELDNVVIPLKFLSQCLEKTKQNNQAINLNPKTMLDFYIDILKHNNKYMEPTINKTYDFMIKGVLMCVTRRTRNMLPKMIKIVMCSTQSNNLDLFTMSVWSNTCQFLIYNNNQMSLEIVA